MSRRSMRVSHSWSPCASRAWVRPRRSSPMAPSSACPWQRFSTRGCRRGCPHEFRGRGTNSSWSDSMSDDLQKKMDEILADWDSDPTCLRISCNEPRWANWDGRGNLSALCKLHTEEVLAGTANAPPLPLALTQVPLNMSDVPNLAAFKPGPDPKGPLGDALHHALKKP